jgi:trimeric autotransporter adhesin
MKPRHALTLIAQLAVATTIVVAPAVTDHLRAVAVDDVATIDIFGPAGSGVFGQRVRVLPNGNFVVTDPLFDVAGKADVGAVYLYDGTSNTLISALRGSTAGDQVGAGGVQVVGTSNAVVLSPLWANGAVPRAGAATWISGATGLAGEVNATNSLVGSHTDDFGSRTTRVLTNGNYALSVRSWDAGAVVDAGAVTWGNGNAGVRGVISAANSLVGVQAGDEVGITVESLTNGNYVVGSPFWALGAVNDAGAATWGDGTSGITGPVTVANSLIGSTADDEVGTYITPLTNGNYVTSTGTWNNVAVNDVGAVTWRPGNAAAAGTVSAANSLVGSTANDRIGPAAVLTNGNYVVNSSQWDRGAIANAGAATWGSGSGGLFGPVTLANSFVGAGPDDGVAAIPLTNGNYVVLTNSWDSGITANVGAVTWRPGNAPAPGEPSLTVSLTGAKTNDRVGSGGVVRLSNGNYVVPTPTSSVGVVVDAGATTWGNGSTGTAGVASAANSVVGDQPGQQVGYVTPLTNGNYVVGSTYFDFGSNVDAGAVLWRPGTSASPATIGVANSLAGTSTNDHVGNYVIALEGGDYLLPSYDWDNGAVVDTGAITRGNGTTGTVGVVSMTNSLVGAKAGDQVGFDVVPYDDGTWVSLDQNVDSASAIDAGAVSVGLRPALTGVISSSTTSFLDVMNEGQSLSIESRRKTARRAIVIGLPVTNRVRLLVPNEFQPLTPARLVDTRPGFATVDGIAAGGGPRDGGSTLEVVVAGRGGVPANAVAAALNVTAVNAGGNGFVTVHPCGQPRPTASSLNITVGATVPNAVIAPIGAGGKVCIFTSQPTHLVVDVNGSFPVTTSLRSSNPARLLDTRPGQSTIDGAQAGTGPNSAGSSIELQVVGRAGVTADAVTVALNVTITEAEGPGFATVYPCGIAPPLASNLNFVAGVDVANLVVAKIGTGGKVCILTSQRAHVVADLTGTFPSAGSYTAIAPARLLDSRPTFATVDGQGAGIGLRPIGTVTPIQVTGRASVPTSATSVVVNVTATEPAGSGFVTVYPCGIDPPLASNLNLTPGVTVPNAAVVKLGTNGTLCLFNSQPTHLVVDIAGYIIG